MELLHIASQLSNLIGAILMGLSIGKDDKEWVDDGDGKKVYAVLLHHPRFFTFGAFLLVIGFGIDLVITLITQV